MTSTVSIHRGRLRRFFIIVAALSFPLYLLLIALDRPVQESGGLIFLLMWIPALAAFIMRLLYGDHFQRGWFKALRLGIPRGKRGAVLLASALALLFPIIVGFSSYGILWSLGMIDFVGEAGRPFLYSLLRAAVFGGLLSIPQVMGEEIGWRGFMGEELRASGYGAPDLLGGLIWSLWHAPLILSGQYASGPYPIVSVLSFTVLMIALHRLWTEWTLELDSLWPAIIAHGAWNTVIQFGFDGHIGGDSASLWVGDSGILTVCVAACVVALLLSASRRSHGFSRKVKRGKVSQKGDVGSRARRGLFSFLLVFLVISCPMDAVERQRKISAVVGAGGVMSPPAPGVDEIVTMPMPYVDISYGRILRLGSEGLSLHSTALAPHSPFRGALFLLPHLGRSESFLPERYDGIGKLPATLEGGFRTGLSLFGILNFHIAAAGDLLGRGHGGIHGESGLSLQLPLRRLGLFLAFEVAVSFGDTAYLNSLYGIDYEQAEASGFERYRADTGLEALRTGVTVRKLFGEHWSLVGKVGVMGLQGEAEESPIVEEPRQYSFQLLTAYRF